MPTDRMLPLGFEDLERFVAAWARPTREERYATRLASSMAQLDEFYDAVAARAGDAMTLLDARDLDDLADDEQRLLQLLYSLVLVSYSVNLFRQQHIPDSGAAFFRQTIEPVV